MISAVVDIKKLDIGSLIRFKRSDHVSILDLSGWPGWVICDGTGFETSIHMTFDKDCTSWLVLISRVREFTHGWFTFDVLWRGRLVSTRISRMSLNDYQLEYLSTH